MPTQPTALFPEWLPGNTPRQVVSGDGDCLLHCMGHKIRELYDITGEFAPPPSLRQWLANFIIANPYFQISGLTLLQWIPYSFNGQSLHEYATSLAASRSHWTGTIELPILSQLWGICIIIDVGNHNTGYNRTTMYTPGGTCRGWLAIQYQPGLHYDILRPGWAGWMDGLRNATESRQCTGLGKHSLRRLILGKVQKPLIRVQ